MGVQDKPVQRPSQRLTQLRQMASRFPLDRLRGRGDFSQLLSAASSIAGLNYSKQTPRSRTFDLKRYGR